ncbi:coiled-coil domain-containing protein 17 [Danio aesculapii]|uniref:coiled-coil domain-containing protein 17 n=1 Tax=Danio aesculapii TaxID=1142201 RepID=UPI0024BF3542|nr:coiled-coil domain-containing protein 17 [Danio aesculapii]
MDILGELICRNCNMVFHSVGLLDKHKAKFCIGTDLKEPLSLWRRQMEKAALHPTRARTPDLIILKEKRRRDDQIEKKQDKAQDNGPHNTALNKLTEEFQKLRIFFEQSLARKHTEVSEEQCLVQQRNDEQRYRDHEQRLAEIRARNLQLEKDRDEIEQRLAELAGRGKTAHFEEVLHELRYQEQRNEEALNQLSSHINTIKGPAPSDVPSNPPEEKKTQHVTFDLMSSVDGPLSAQIRALRLAYMQSGGSDPEVLAHMHDLQTEALTLERTRLRSDGKTKARRMKSPQRSLDPDILAVEQENQRLEEEIFKIQLARERHKGEPGLGLIDIQKDHIHQMASLQAEIAFLSREIEQDRERRPHHRQSPLPVFPESSMALTHPALDQSSFVADSIEALGPAQYDPAAGFAIFYDIIIGIEATLRSVRLLAGLYCNGQPLGPTTTMPPVQCQPAGSLFSAKSPGNYAILAAKQPVPSVQPSPDLSLVMEIQTFGSLDFYKHQIEGFATFGWAKLELFDQHNQVHSGFWRLPFHSLPVQAALTSRQLNSMPQLGKMEVCLRVVNGCDGDVQTLAEMDPNIINQDKYLKGGHKSNPGTT